MFLVVIVIISFPFAFVICVASAKPWFQLPIGIALNNRGRFRTHCAKKEMGRFR